MTQLVLDTHVLYWMWASDTERLSSAARRSVAGADRLLVAAITWYELALLFERGRLESVSGNPGSALASMAERVTTAPLTWRIARRAAALEANPAFPRDPADRLIYATAADRDAKLVTADEQLRRFSADLCIW